MPLYRVTMKYTGPDGLNYNLVTEVFGYGPLIPVCGKTPEQIEAIADKQRRGAVVVNLPSGVQTEIEVVERPDPPVYLSPEEERALEILQRCDLEFGRKWPARDATTVNILANLTRKGYANFHRGSTAYVITARGRQELDRRTKRNQGSP